MVNLIGCFDLDHRDEDTTRFVITGRIEHIDHHESSMRCCHHRVFALAHWGVFIDRTRTAHHLKGLGCISELVLEDLDPERADSSEFGAHADKAIISATATMRTADERFISTK